MKFWSKIVRHVRMFFPVLYASKLFPWKNFPLPIYPVRQKFGWMTWLWGRIKPQTFPYQNVLEADQASVQVLKNVLVYELHRLADQAHACRDYRAHAIYCMAANRLVHLHHLEKELEILKRNEKRQGKN